MRMMLNEYVVEAFVSSFRAGPDSPLQGPEDIAFTGRRDNQVTTLEKYICKPNNACMIDTEWGYYMSGGTRQAEIQNPSER